VESNTVSIRHGVDRLNLVRTRNKEGRVGDARRGLELRKKSHVRFGLKEIDPNYLEVNKRRAEEATESSRVVLP
jgi:hypothetical protein